MSGSSIMIASNPTGVAGKFAVTYNEVTTCTHTDESGKKVLHSPEKCHNRKWNAVAKIEGKTFTGTTGTKKKSLADLRMQISSAYPSS